MRSLFLDARFSEHTPAFSGLTLLLLALLCLHPTPTRAASDTVGVDWDLAGSLPASYPYNLQQMVSFNDRLWIFGGTYESLGTKYLSSAAWNSTDGITWTTASTQLPFLGGSTRSSPAVFKWNQKLWAFRQATVAPWQTLIWCSENGTDWTEVPGWAPALGGGTVPSFAEFNGKLWLVLGDQFFSSTDAMQWTTELSPFQYTSIYAHLCTFKNKLWIITESDLFVSSDGLTWSSVDREIANKPSVPDLVIYGLYVFDQRMYCETQLGVYSTFDGESWVFQPSKITNLVESPRFAVFDGKVWITSQTKVWCSNLAGPPQIASITSPQHPIEGQPFTLAEPHLNNGIKPITWSLLDAPANMQVDPQTGIITWVPAGFAINSHSVTLMADNVLGSDTAVIEFQAVAQTATVATAPRFTSTPQCTITWQPIPNISDFTLQADDTADFASPFLDIAVSSTTLQYTVSGLAENDHGYHFRVRGNKRPPLSSVWSEPVICVRDAAGPQFTFMPISLYVPPAMSMLSIDAIDPGTNPSGLAEMRLSLANTQNSWIAYKSTIPCLLPTSTSQVISVELKDNVGNITSHSITVSPNPLPPVVWVDASAPADGGNGTVEDPYGSIEYAFHAPNFDVAIVQGTYDIDWVLEVSNGIRLTGGYPYAGATENDPIKYPTILTSHEPFDHILGAHNIDYIVLRNLTLTRWPRTYDQGHIVDFSQISLLALLQNCTIEGLATERWDGMTLARSIGSALRLNHVNARLENCTIRDNSAGEGGGIWATNGSSVTLLRSRIISNSVFLQTLHQNGTRPGSPGYDVVAGNTGGAFYFQNSNLTINQCYLANNSPVFFGSNSELHAINSVFDHNAELLRYASSSNLDLCTIASSPIITTTASLSARNSIFYNFASASPNLNLLDCVLYPAAASTITGTRLTFANPKFIDAVNGNYRLAMDSPCIDAGSAMQGITVDIAGNTRPVQGIDEPRGDGSHFDIGAYEFQRPLIAEIITISPLRSGSLVAVKWRSDFVFSGSAVRIELWSEHGVIALLQTAWNSSAQDTTSVQLPLLAPGHTYFIRVRSDYNPQVFADAPLAISFDGNAAANWTAYD